MTNAPILDELARARLTGMEYGELSREEVERIYIRENKELPPSFDIYSAKELGIGGKSGFDGTAIHFYDEENKVNQVYLFARGTEHKTDDIMYDALGVFAGKTHAQAGDAIDFHTAVTSEIAEKDIGIPLREFGDGHSLGGHDIGTLAAITGSFEQVNSFNGAPVNGKHLPLLDEELGRAFQAEYGKEPTQRNIYTMSEAEMNGFIKEFYDAKSLAAVMKYINTEEDPLTNQSVPYSVHFYSDTNLKVYDAYESERPADFVKNYPGLVDYLYTGLNAGTDKSDGFFFALKTAAYTNPSLAGYHALKSRQFDRDFKKDLEGVEWSAHSMNIVIKQIALEEGRMINGNKEILTVKDAKSGKMIKLPIEESLQFYMRCLGLITAKEYNAERLEESFMAEFEEDYPRKVDAVSREMEWIEANFRSYLGRNDYYTPDTESIVIYKNFRFLETFPNKLGDLHALFDTVKINLRNKVEKEKALMEAFKEGIITMTKSDESVALLFNLYTERSGW